MKPVVAEDETLVGDVLDLQAFALAADLRSFTETAKRMGESKATISRRIARLEAALGVSLLRRTPRVVEPTDDGVAYRLRVAEILELLADANATVRRAHAEPSGVLRVTTPPGFEDVLAPVFARFMAQFPHVVVSALVSERFVDLDAEHIDVAVRATRELADSALVAHRLFESDAVAVAAPAYLAAHGTPRRPSELASHRIVRLGPPGARPLAMQRDREAPVELRLACALATSDIRFARTIALAGAGIAVLPRVAIRRELDDGSLTQVLRAYVVRGPMLYLLHRGGRFLPPKVRAFRELAVRELAHRPR